MSEIFVEVIKAFNYSPNGWDNERAKVGDEIYLDEVVAKGLMGEPPFVKIGEKEKPTVFSSDDELVEKLIGDVDETFSEIIEDVEDQPEVEIEVETEGQEIEIDETEIEVDTSSKSRTLDDLNSLIEVEGKFTDIEIDGLDIKKKNGNWYDIYRGEEKLNEKGIARTKIAEFIFNLEEV